MTPASSVTRPESVTANGKPARPAKADSFKQAMARAMEGAGPAATPAQLAARPGVVRQAGPAGVTSPAAIALQASRGRPADAAFRDRIALMESSARAPDQGLAARNPASGALGRYLTHRTETPDAPLSPAQRSSFAAVERRLRDFAELPYTLATRATPRGNPVS